MSIVKCSFNFLKCKKNTNLIQVFLKNKTGIID
jgi:hypothetical protein